jgi:hypothetical protein
MAAGLGFKNFQTGEVLTSADVNGYLMQGVLVFASEAARDAAITSPQEGQFAYTKDNNSLWYYTGSAWAASGATGDIEGVTAGTGISGGGTSGTVTITNSMATAIDAKGDLVVGTGADTFSRLAVGTNGHVLTADSTVSPTGLKWQAASAGALTLITSDTFTSISSKSYNNCFSATYKNYLMLVNLTTSGSVAISLKFRASGTDNSSNYRVERIISNFNGLTRQSNGLGTDEAFFGVGPDSTFPGTYNEVKLMNPFETQGTGFIASSATNESGGTTQSLFGGVHADTTSYDGFTIFFTASSSGSLQLYGLGI